MSEYTEEEQIARIKEWWQQNGKPLLVGGALAIVIVFGWQAWQQHQEKQSQNCINAVSAIIRGHCIAQ